MHTEDMPVNYYKLKKKSSKLNRETTKTTRKLSEGKNGSITVKNFK